MEKMPDIPALIEKMAGDIQARMNLHRITEYEIVGIRTGGVWIAEKLSEALNRPSPVGELNISFYRDDFTRIGLHPHVSASSLPFAIDDKHIILVDDVLMSGRTVRAAMNELFDYGRPSSIHFAVLIDLEQRELPIAPSIVGQTITVSSNERIKLTGPENLQISIQQVLPNDN